MNIFKEKHIDLLLTFPRLKKNDLPQYSIFNIWYYKSKFEVNLRRYSLLLYLYLT